MVTETISEPQFLVTELHYTLGQLHVQVLDLDAATRSEDCDGESVDSILADMIRAEKQYQSEYQRILSTPPSEAPSAETVPLPINESEEEPGPEARFEHLRAETIALVQTAPDEWPQELLDLVKKHVADDRERTTQIADCRRQFFFETPNPVLDEPLTGTT